MSGFTDDVISQFKRLAERIRNLELSVYVYGKQPDEPPLDFAVDSLTGTTSFYVEPVSLLQRGSIEWTWHAPSTQDDDPISHYMVSVTRSTDGTTGVFNNVGDVTSLVTSGHPLNTNVTLRIYVVTERGVRGPTSLVTVVVPKPVTTPPQPSTPTWAAGIKSAYITNDGKTSSDFDMPADVTHYEVYKLDNGAASFTPALSNYYASMGLRDTIVIPANDDYHDIAVRLIAVNSAGNKSTASTGVVVTPKKILNSDFDITLPTGAVYSEEGSLIKDGTFESPTIRGLRPTTSASWAGNGFTYENAVGGAKHGEYFLKYNNALLGGADRAYYFTALTYNDSDPVSSLRIISAGKYYVSFQARNIGASNNINFTCHWALADGSVVTTAKDWTAAEVSSGDWEQLQTVFAAPDNATLMRPYILVRSGSTTGEWHFDSFEIRRVIGTELIEDAAITRAKIGEAAIGTAQIEEVDAALIKSGIIDANRIGANSIETRHFLAGAVTPAVTSDDLGEALDIQSNPALSDMASKSIVDGMVTNLGSVTSTLTNLTNAVRIDAAGVTINDVSNTSNPASVVLNSQGLNLYEGTARVAYINGQVMYIRSSEIANQLKIGAHIIERHDANNTFIRWVG